MYRISRFIQIMKILPQGIFDWVVQTHNHYKKLLRRVTIARPEQGPLILASNDLVSPAASITRRYKNRWAIELFCK